MSRLSAFQDDRQYLAPDAVRWEDISFAGYRLAAKRRRGGVDDGLHTLTFAHRRVVADRYQLRLLLQRCPESDRGVDEGLPMQVNRYLVEIGAPVREDLFALARVTREPSTSNPGWGGESFMVGLAGTLSEQERVQASVARESECWDDVTSDLTRVTLMYSRRVDEERHASVKVGYGWGQDDLDGAVREYRVTVAYKKPI